MNDTWFKVKQIGALVLFVIIASMLGLITKNPMMMIGYGVFFILVTIGVLLMIRNRQRHFEFTNRSNRTLMLVLAGLMGLLALVLPLILAKTSSIISLPEGAGNTGYVAVAGLNILFLALNLGGLFLINFKGDSLVMRIVGFLCILIAAIIPGAVVSGYDRTSVGIGSVYYIALIVLVLAYNSFNLLYKRD
ncbi:MAG TPA: hypothetical protein PL124_04640 [Candidatus Cloacimonadota bacterium]|nr:hypothetical protein [Candidatus Cloacimonadota bacterium]HPS38681.1 hypothetical protein [Candidatus Cloacimonadota bacterium]